ncbi:hypothetical protein NH340_JMT07452 [Sarcoptes scabiei]|nr:hypothetical protein NH340_JMT07452 [Sarcoptes scabiei]
MIEIDDYFLENFIKKCRLFEDELIEGKRQLSIDSQLLMVYSKKESNPNGPDETPISFCMLRSSKNQYLLNLIKKCPSIKIVHSPRKSFCGLIDLSLIESCQHLEFIRIPFHQLKYIDPKIRRNLKTLLWNRADNCLLDNHHTISSIGFETDNSTETIKINEKFWDEFGQWNSLTNFSLCNSNVSQMDLSSMPETIKILNFRYNRIVQFNNLINNSIISRLTELYLDYNSIKRLPEFPPYSFSLLIRLSLRCNLLKSIAGLRNLTALSYLDISENLIHNVDQFLDEISNLNSLKSLMIENNPIAFHDSIQRKVQNILVGLNYLNNKSIKSPTIQRFLIPKIVYNESLSTSISDDLASSTPSDSTSNIFQHRKTRRPITRFIKINDNETTIEQIDSKIPAQNLPKKRLDSKNYFFGGFSGSYENSIDSFSASTVAEKDLILVESTSALISEKHIDSSAADSESFHIQKTNRSDDLQKVERQQSLGQIVTDINEDKTKTNSTNDLFSIEKLDTKQTVEIESIQQQDQNLQVQKKMSPFQTSSEWTTEDAEDDTMFLVEIFQNLKQFEEIQEDNDGENQTSEYYFIRIRPSDGILFEKDCTSGKILQRFDLKVLQRFERIEGKNSSQQQLAVVKLCFDTVVNLKKERIYKFSDQKSLNDFVENYLSKFVPTDTQTIPQTKTIESKTINADENQSKPKNRLYYLCLCCGQRSNRIVADCQKCGSKLIIREIESSTKISRSNNLFSNENSKMHPIIGESISLNNETIRIDANYFHENIDYSIKLLVEIYLYEKINDETLRTETVEMLLHCCRFDFNDKIFRPSLIVFTENYLLLFDHLNYDYDEKDEFDCDDEKILEKSNTLKLILFLSLTDDSSPRIVLSHLPTHLKHLGYWLESELSPRHRQILTATRFGLPRRKFALELILFGDDETGKAFLDIIQSFRLRRSHSNLHRTENLREIACNKSLTAIVEQSANNENLNGDEDDDRFSLHLDDICNNYLKNQSLTIRKSFENDRDGNNEIIMFLLNSFRFQSDIDLNTVNLSRSCTPMNQSNSFAINENIILILIDDHIIVGELYCDFRSLKSLLNQTSNQSISVMLNDAKRKNRKTYNDRFEIKTLFNEWIVNLMPNIFIDKTMFILVMRFRDDVEDDGFKEERIARDLVQKNSSGVYHQEHRSSLASIQIDMPSSRVYELKLRFLNLNSLLRTCRILSSWEKKFGFPLTILKY